MTEAPDQVFVFLDGHQWCEKHEHTFGRDCVPGCTGPHYPLAYQAPAPKFCDLCGQKVPS